MSDVILAQTTFDCSLQLQTKTVRKNYSWTLVKFKARKTIFGKI